MNFTTLDAVESSLGSIFSQVNKEQFLSSHKINSVSDLHIQSLINYGYLAEDERFEDIEYPQRINALLEFFRWNELFERFAFSIRNITHNPTFRDYGGPFAFWLLSFYTLFYDVSQDKELALSKVRNFVFPHKATLFSIEICMQNTAINSGSTHIHFPSQSEDRIGIIKAVLKLLDREQIENLEFDSKSVSIRHIELCTKMKEKIQPHNSDEYKSWSLLYQSLHARQDEITYQRKLGWIDINHSLLHS